MGPESRLLVGLVKTSAYPIAVLLAFAFVAGPLCRTQCEAAASVEAASAAGPEAEAPCHVLRRSARGSLPALVPAATTAPSAPWPPRPRRHRPHAGRAPPTGRSCSLLRRSGPRCLWLFLPRAPSRVRHPRGPSGSCASSSASAVGVRPRPTGRRSRFPGQRTDAGACLEETIPCRGRRALRGDGAGPARGTSRNARPDADSRPAGARAPNGRRPDCHRVALRTGGIFSSPTCCRCSAWFRTTRCTG